MHVSLTQQMNLLHVLKKHEICQCAKRLLLPGHLFRMSSGLYTRSDLAAEYEASVCVPLLNIHL